MAYWIEHQPANQSVASLIPSQGTCLGCGSGAQQGVCERQLIDVSIAHPCFSSNINVSLPLFLFPFLLSQNKEIQSKKGKHISNVSLYVIFVKFRENMRVNRKNQKNCWWKSYLLFSSLHRIKPYQPQNVKTMCHRYGKINYEVVMNIFSGI